VLATSPLLAWGAAPVFWGWAVLTCTCAAATTTPAIPSGTPSPADPWSPNNSGSATVNISNPPPVVTPPANLTLQCASQVPPPNASDATVSDNCGTPSVSVSDTNNGGAGSPPSPLGITRTFTAIASAGYSSSAAQTITVIDSTPPVASCPADITTAGNIAGSCGAIITQATPTAIDNCSGTLNMVGTRSDSLPLPAAYPLGVTMITW